MSQTQDRYDTATRRAVSEAKTMRADMATRCKLADLERILIKLFEKRSFRPG